MSTRVEYRIQEKYEADTARAEQALDRLGRSYGKVSKGSDRTERDLRKLEGRLANVTTWLKRAAGAAVAFAAYRGAQAGISGMVGGLKAIEDAAIGVGTSLRLNEDVATFEEGIERGTAVVRRFREEAKKSPATMRDFLAIYTTALPVMLQAKKADLEMEQMTKRLVFFGSSLGDVPFEEVGRSAGMTLSGAAGIDSVVWRILGPKLGGDVSAWNKTAKEDPKKAFEALLAVLAPAEEAAEIAGKSFGGLSATLSDLKDATLERAGTPLFETMKRDMSELVGLADDNADAVDRWADKFGANLLGAYDSLKSTGAFLVENLNTILDVSVEIAKIWALGKLGGIGAGLAAWGQKTAGSAAGGKALAGDLGDDVFFDKSSGRYARRVSTGVGGSFVQPLSGRESMRAGFAGAKAKGAGLAARAATGIGSFLSGAATIAIGLEVGHFVIEQAFGLGESIAEAMEGPAGRMYRKSFEEIGKGGGDNRFLGVFGASTPAEQSFLAKQIQRSYKGYRRQYDEWATDGDMTGAVTSAPEWNPEDLVSGWKSALVKFREAEEAATKAKVAEEARSAAILAKADKEEKARLELEHSFFLLKRSIGVTDEIFGSLGDELPKFLAALAAPPGATVPALAGVLFNFLAGKLVEPKVEQKIYGGVKIVVQGARNPERVAVLTKDVLLTAASSPQRMRSGTTLVPGGAYSG